MHVILAVWEETSISCPDTWRTTTGCTMESKPKQRHRATSRIKRLAKVASKETDGRSAGLRDEDDLPETVKTPDTQTSCVVQDVEAVQDTTVDHDSDSKAETSRKRGRKSRSSSRRPPTTLGLDSDDEEYVVEEDEGRARKSSKRKTATKASGRGPEEARTCPHCQKVCSTKYGLKYHLGTSKTDPALQICISLHHQTQTCETVNL